MGEGGGDYAGGFGQVRGVPPLGVVLRKSFVCMDLVELGVAKFVQAKGLRVNSSI